MEKVDKEAGKQGNNSLDSQPPIGFLVYLSTCYLSCYLYICWYCRQLL